MLLNKDNGVRSRGRHRIQWSCVIKGIMDLCMNGFDISFQLDSHVSTCAFRADVFLIT